MELSVGNRDFKCVQERAGDVIDTREISNIYQTLLSKRTLGGAVELGTNMVFSRKFPCVAKSNLFLIVKVVRYSTGR